jgi:glycosyltransferase involved in cell wall biosynthesis
VRVLIATFYFPPAGGGGVQRPLKFARHLTELGFDVHVLAPDDPMWIHRDPLVEIPAGVKVHRAHYMGPRGRLPGEELHGLHGAERATRKLALFPRRLLVPDENVLWVLNALPVARRVIRREGIDVVLTTSPPNSIHLLGAGLRRTTGVRWVADLRDALVAKEDRDLDRALARAKDRTQAGIARLVAHRADAIVGVTDSIAASVGEFAPRGSVHVIPNGSDFDDVAGLAYEPADRLRVTHTGSFFGRRDPRPALQALLDVDPRVVARFIGDLRPGDREFAATLGLGDRLELDAYRPHAETIAAQRESDVLLLLLPDIGERGRDIPSGKLFEYIAARRPILAAVPPDGTAASIIRELGAGVVVPPDDVEAIAAALRSLVAQWEGEGLPDVELTDDHRRRLSRRTRAEELARVLRQWTGPGPE